MGNSQENIQPHTNWLLIKQLNYKGNPLLLKNKSLLAQQYTLDLDENQYEQLSSSMAHNYPNIINIIQKNRNNNQKIYCHNKNIYNIKTQHLPLRLIDIKNITSNQCQYILYGIYKGLQQLKISKHYYNNLLNEDIIGLNQFGTIKIIILPFNQNLNSQNQYHMVQDIAQLIKIKINNNQSIQFNLEKLYSSNIDEAVKITQIHNHNIGLNLINQFHNHQKLSSYYQQQSLTKQFKQKFISYNFHNQLQINNVFVYKFKNNKNFISPNNSINTNHNNNKLSRSASTRIQPKIKQKTQTIYGLQANNHYQTSINSLKSSLYSFKKGRKRQQKIELKKINKQPALPYPNCPQIIQTPLLPPYRSKSQPNIYFNQMGTKMNYQIQSYKNYPCQSTISPTINHSTKYNPTSNLAKTSSTPSLFHHPLIYISSPIPHFKLRKSSIEFTYPIEHSSLQNKDKQKILSQKIQFNKQYQSSKIIKQSMNYDYPKHCSQYYNFDYLQRKTNKIQNHQNHHKYSIKITKDQNKKVQQISPIKKRQIYKQKTSIKAQIQDTKSNEWKKKQKIDKGNIYLKNQSEMKKLSQQKIKSISQQFHNIPKLKHSESDKVKMNNIKTKQRQQNKRKLYNKRFIQQKQSINNQIQTNQYNYYKTNHYNKYNKRDQQIVVNNKEYKIKKDKIKIQLQQQNNIKNENYNQLQNNNNYFIHQQKKISLKYINQQSKIQQNKIKLYNTNQNNQLSQKTINQHIDKNQLKLKMKMQQFNKLQQQFNSNDQFVQQQSNIHQNKSHIPSNNKFLCSFNFQKSNQIEKVTANSTTLTNKVPKLKNDYSEFVTLQQKLKKFVLSNKKNMPKANADYKECIKQSKLSNEKKIKQIQIQPLSLKKIEQQQMIELN